MSERVSFMNWTEKYNKAVTFSYDDGVLQDIRLVELLNQYHLKCTFNINSGLGPQNGSFDIDDLKISRLSLYELKEVYKGHEVALHSLTHPFLTRLPLAEAEYELHQDKLNIEKTFEEKVLGMAYPYGVYNQEIVEMLKKEKLHYGRTVEDNHSFALQENLLKFRPTSHHNDPLLWDLVNEFLESKNKDPQILYIWGHSYEFDIDDNWDRMEHLCKIVSGRPDIYYGTNAQVLLNDTECPYPLDRTVGYYESHHLQLSFTMKYV